ncbi:hypothetical protein BO71DRAFT_397966 [Aspergillus ellipticus CBS 707.79]|uniref:Arginase/deacetylase n=1 Tax=Aspergillus ellipticus CBS 707.79 TaxID=1448320 RepID=A0A319DDQ5_9EURO|nr:hypothetical protein BO71DRAFT_397966 [Aspergillus ellipticus CBS 707.79]
MQVFSRAWQQNGQDHPPTTNYHPGRDRETLPPKNMLLAFDEELGHGYKDPLQGSAKGRGDRTLLVEVAAQQVKARRRKVTEIFGESDEDEDDDEEEATESMKGLFCEYYIVQMATHPHPRIVSLGGDHSIVLPILRSLKSAYGPVAVIHLDSHLDTWGSGRGVHGDCVGAVGDHPWGHFFGMPRVRGVLIVGTVCMGD